MIQSLGNKLFRKKLLAAANKMTAKQKAYEQYRQKGIWPEDKELKADLINRFRNQEKKPTWKDFIQTPAKFQKQLTSLYNTNQPQAENALKKRIKALFAAASRGDDAFLSGRPENKADDQTKLRDYIRAYAGANPVNSGIGRYLDDLISGALKIPNPTQQGANRGVVANSGKIFDDVLNRKVDYPNLETILPDKQNNFNVLGNWGLNHSLNSTRRLQNFIESRGMRLDTQNPDNQYYQGLNKLGLARYSQGKWRGTIVEKNVSSIKDSNDRNSIKMKKAQSLLNTKANQAEIETYVPGLIVQLVKSSQQLTRSGFGPIKEKGMPLYVGRWIDPVTATIRLFPTASTKYVNPLYISQKITYQQAKMLNSWNQLVSHYQKVSYLTANQDKLQQKNQLKLTKQLKNSLVIKETYADYGNFINQQIVNYFSTPFNQERLLVSTSALSVRNLLLSYVGDDKLRILYKTVPNFPKNAILEETLSATQLANKINSWDNMTQSQLFKQFMVAQPDIQGLRLKIAVWQTAISRAQDQLMKVLDRQRNPTVHNYHVRSMVPDAVYYLTTYVQRKAMGTVKKIMKIELLPNGKTNPKEMSNILQGYQSMQSELNKNTKLALKGSDGDKLNDAYKIYRQQIEKNGLGPNTIKGATKSFLTAFADSNNAIYGTKRLGGAKKGSRYEHIAKYRKGASQDMPQYDYRIPFYSLRPYIPIRKGDLANTDQRGGDDDDEDIFEDIQIIEQDDKEDEAEDGSKKKKKKKGEE